MLRKHGPGLNYRRGDVRRLINTLHPARVKMEVAAILPETPSARTLRLVSPDGSLPPFQAGQYVNLFLEVGGIRTSRPYSISSSPCQTGHWDITRLHDLYAFGFWYDDPELRPGGGRFYQPRPARSMGLCRGCEHLGGGQGAPGAHPRPGPPLGPGGGLPAPGPGRPGDGADPRPGHAAPGAPGVNPAPLRGYSRREPP